ncbi:MAG: TetR/AcrR family transcriptional regulator [Leptospira sp.]|nr:TetR/AcrR family transcriptional regulator [Leptospira sp.]
MPKIVDHELYREELLGKSMAIFVEKGVASVSMRELSKELGVSTGTLYHYFPTKEALFSSMVRFFVAKDAKEITEISELGEKSVWELLNYISTKESHFLNLILLALDVRRHHADSSDLSILLEESWNSYRLLLDRFFPEEKNTHTGEAFLSFFVGALFLKTSRHKETKWLDLFEGLGQISNFFRR